MIHFSFGHKIVGPTKIEREVGLDIIDNLEGLAADSACLFVLPRKPKFAKVHELFLDSTQSGHCQFLETSGGNGEGFAYISLPALQHIAASFDSLKERNEWLVMGPMFSALYGLSGALSDHTCYEGRGKAFESVLLQSLLLHARSNILSPRQWCSTCGFDVELYSGNVALWTDIDSFPYSPEKLTLADQVQKFVNRLVKEKADGALFQPTNTSNRGGDVFGLFKNFESGSYELFVFECKSWFLDTSPKHKTLREAWNHSKEIFLNESLWENVNDIQLQTENPSMLPRDGLSVNVGGSSVPVNVRFILASANDPDEDL